MASSRDDAVGAAGVMLRRHLLALFVAVVAGCGGSGSSEPPVAVEPPAPAPAPAPAAPPAAAPLALATMDIVTGGAVIDRENYVTGTYTVTDADGAQLHAGAIDIRGRGNTTWLLDKKPYRIRLAQTAALLGMPTNRHWVLLANHADKSLLRNDVTFEFGRLLGMAWTPRSRSVHVRLDGRYDGVYQLTEHIRIGSERVNIDTLSTSVVAEPEITGGYLLEIDELAAGDIRCVTTARDSVTFCGQDPDPLFAQPAQRDYIASYLQRTEDALYAPDFADPQTGYAAYLDVDSVIQYFLASELVRNVDGDLRRSTYLFKPRNGKLFFGPLWDFDLALGNADYLGADNPEGWYVRTAPWYTRLFEDPQFAARVSQKWREMKQGGQLDALLAYVDRRGIELSEAQAENFARWPVLDTRLLSTVVRPAPNSHAAEVGYMRAFLVARIAWMDAQLTPP